MGNLFHQNSTGNWIYIVHTPKDKGLEFIYGGNTERARHFREHVLDEIQISCMVRLMTLLEISDAGVRKNIVSLQL
jgi:hypothetical protein